MKLAEMKKDYEYGERRFRIDIAMTIIIWCTAILMFLKYGLLHASVILEIGLGVILAVNLFYRWRSLKEAKRIMDYFEEKEDDR